MRNRKVQKELKQQGFYNKFGKDGSDRQMIDEERLNRTMECGISDPTPREAVDKIIAEQKALVRVARARVKTEGKTTAAMPNRSDTGQFKHTTQIIDSCGRRVNHDE